MSNYQKYNDGSTTLQWAFQNQSIDDLIPGMEVTDCSVKRKPEFDEKGTGTEGLVVARVKTTETNDEIDLEFKGYITDEDAFESASDFTYNGRFFIIGPRDETFNNRKYQMCTISASSNVLVTQTTT